MFDNLIKISSNLCPCDLSFQIYVNDHDQSQTQHLDQAQEKALAYFNIKHRKTEQTTTTNNMSIKLGET